MHLRPYDLLLFGGSCAVSGMMLVLAVDALEASHSTRSVVLPLVACLLSLVGALFALRVARLRDADRSAA